MARVEYIECDHADCAVRIQSGDIEPDYSRFLEMAEYYGWHINDDYGWARCPLHNAQGTAIRILFEIFGRDSQMQKYVEYI